LCHDIYPVRPITTVYLSANTYCMMVGHSSCAPRTAATGSNSTVRMNRAIDDQPRDTAGGHLLSVVQASTNASETSQAELLGDAATFLQRHAI